MLLDPPGSSLVFLLLHIFSDVDWLPKDLQLPRSILLALVSDSPLCLFYFTCPCR